MAMLDYEVRGIPQTVKTNNKLGIFNSDLPTFGVTLHAMTLAFPMSLDHMCSFSSHLIGTRAHEVLLNELMAREMFNTKVNALRFKSDIRAAIDRKLPIAVSVLISGNGKCETVSSFMVGSSAQLYVGCRKNLNLQNLIKKTKTPLHSRLANCAHCMATFEDLAEKSEDFPFERPLKKCSGCKCVFYCSLECQQADWTRGHDTACPIFRWLSPHMDQYRTGTEDEWMDGILACYKRKVEKNLVGSKYAAVVMV
jgi:hypothetical protein